MTLYESQFQCVVAKVLVNFACNLLCKGAVSSWQPELAGDISIRMVKEIITPEVHCYYDVHEAPFILWLPS